LQQCQLEYDADVQYLQLYADVQQYGELPDNVLIV
jgi:hypothetical protein